MGLCWNHTATKTKQGSKGVIWAQQEISLGEQQLGGGKGMGGCRWGVWVGIAVKVLIVS